MVSPLTGMGEHLVAEMINQLGASFFDLCLPPPEPDRLKVQSGKQIAFANVRLRDYSGRAFDPMHRVDVVVMIDDHRAIPFEVKLGNTKLSAQDVQNRLAPCTGSHYNTRWRGNVMSILARNFEHGGTPGSLETNIGGRTVELTPDWYLIARDGVVRRLTGAKIPMGLVAFEELARKVGREPFNDIVRAHLPNDFYEAWVQTARQRDRR